MELVREVNHQDCVGGQFRGDLDHMAQILALHHLVKHGSNFVKMVHSSFENYCLD